MLVLGPPGVGLALREAGIETRTVQRAGGEEVDAVYVGWHPDCGMKDIEAGLQCDLGGRETLRGLGRAVLRLAAGRTIGYSYAITGAIRRVTKAPMILTGKPSRHALQFRRAASRRAGSRVGVVGDDPLVEMIMARRGGATAFGVTTGVTSAADWRRQPLSRRPHRVLSDLRDLLKLLP